MAAWVTGTVLALSIGTMIASAQLTFGRWASRLLTLYIETVRGTPFLVQLFIIYYGGPFIGLDFNALTVGIVCLGIYGSPYFAEICRGSFKTVTHGQTEAAECLGISRAAILRRIMLPQMFAIGLPSFVNMSIVMLKETAVLSVITVPELTYQISGIGSETFAFAECYVVLALAYWAITEATSAVGIGLERHLSRYL